MKVTSRLPFSSRGTRTDIRDIRDLPGDLQLEIVLRPRALRLRQVLIVSADLRTSIGEGPCMAEGGILPPSMKTLEHLRVAAQSLCDELGDGLIVGERGAGRQLESQAATAPCPCWGGNPDGRRVALQIEAANSHQPGEDGGESMPDRPGHEPRDRS